MTRPISARPNPIRPPAAEARPTSPTMPSKPSAAPSRPLDYLERSELPLASLLLLLPLVIIYEAGTRFLTVGALQGGEKQIVAFLLMRQFFALFGANGRHLPALAVVSILLTWHIARNDRWRVPLATLAGMILESIVLALPLLVIGVVIARYFPLEATAPLPPAAMTPLSERTGDLVILSFGAGVYEELVFRLILFTLLNIILRDVFRMTKPRACMLMLLASGLTFSAYHYLSPEEHFTARTFVFRTVAGIYFGAVFLTRGIGITAASHAAYDIFIVML